jgi:subfamily B ATP-binding cassette protein MsbA
MKKPKLNFKSEDFKIIKRLIQSYAKPFLPSLILAVFLMIIVALCASAYAFLVKNAMDKIFIEKNIQMLMLLPLTVICITFIKNIAMYFQMVLMQLFAQNITNALQKDVFHALLRLDLKKFNKMHTGIMLGIITQSVNGITNGINLIFTTLIRELLTIVFLMAVMFYQNLQLALISAIAVPFIFIPLSRITKRLRKLTTTGMQNVQGFIASLDDSLKSIRLIKTYGTENFEEKKIASLIAQRFKITKKMILTSNLSGPIVECLSIIGIAFVIWYGGNNVISGKTTPGTFFAFFVSMTIAYKPFKSLTNINLTIMQFLAAGKQFFEILDTKSELNESENPIIITKLKGLIEFKDVSFKYEDEALKYTLSDVNITILPNKKTSFVGPTGAGKSTIISLIMRLYDPNKGQILLDGINLKDIAFKTLRENISYVGQDIQLFDDTILNNILYSKPNANMEEVIKATKLANAHSFIEKMPEGFNTNIGQSGVNLSGGQKQRLSIARAILKDSNIIILDEPTSSLDAISEELIKEALENFTKNKTVIVIAHRLSTIVDSHNIYVIEDGKITENGNHEILLAKKGHYATLYNTQFKINTNN